MICVAGYGARFLPITKVLNKAMLPILTRPAVEYLVRDCIAAGVTDIAFVVRPDDSQVRAYFTENHEMKGFFIERGWHEKYQQVAHVHEGANFTFLVQGPEAGYGTAIPAVIAAEFVDGDDFLLLTGDDFVLRAGGSDIGDLVRARRESGAGAAITATTVPDEEVFRYGSLVTRERGGVSYLTGAVEKPAPGTAPSNLVNISRFLLPFEMMTELARVPADPRSGERRSIDAVVNFAQHQDVLVHRSAGQYFDCGQVSGWLAANQAAYQLEQESSG